MPAAKLPRSLPYTPLPPAINNGPEKNGELRNYYKPTKYTY
jgi:hypothetical protein